MTITINRPEVRNAIDEQTAQGLAAALEELDPDPALVAAVLTGAGGTFCSGMDLRAFLAGERPSRGVAFELAHEHRGARQGGERRRADEATARWRLHDADGVTGAGGQTHELERLVCGNAAADAEQYARHGLSPLVVGPDRLPGKP